MSARVKLMMPMSAAVREGVAEETAFLIGAVDPASGCLGLFIGPTLLSCESEPPHLDTWGGGRLLGTLVTAQRRAELLTHLLPTRIVPVHDKKP